MANINNINEAWGGQNPHTGAEVEQFIKGTLTTHENALNSAVYGMKFEVDETDNSIHYSFQNRDGSYTDNPNDKFTLIPPSTNILEVSDVELSGTGYIKHGQNVSFSYSYKFTNESGSGIALSSGAEVWITNSTTNTTIKAGQTVPYRGTSRMVSGTFDIPSKFNGQEFLIEGENNITVWFQVKYNGALSRNDNVFNNQLIYSLDLKVSTTLNAQTVYADGIQFGNYITVSNSKGTNPEIGQATIVPYFWYNGNSYSTITNNTPYKFATTGETSGAKTVFLYAQVEKDGQVVTKSDVIMAQIFVDTTGDTIPSLSNIPDGSFSSIVKVVEATNATPQVKVVGYTPIQFNIYSYNAGTVHNSLNNQNVITSSEQLYDLSFIYTFKGDAPTLTLLGEVGNPFTLSFILEASTTGYVEPTGMTLDLSAAGKQEGYPDWSQTTFTNFDGVGNGYKSVDNTTAILFNSGASALINYSPCATDTYSISIKFKTLSSVEDEVLISCMSSNTGFNIYANKVEFRNGDTLLERNFDSADIHEITLVNGDNQNKMVLYIDGCIQGAVQRQSNPITHNTKITAQVNKSVMYLYSVKAFRRALSFTEVQSLYALNLPTYEQIAAYIADNSIFNVNTSSFKTGGYGPNVKISQLPTGSKYIVLESNNDVDTAQSGATPWEIINGYHGDAEEEKKIYHYIESVKLITKGGGDQSFNFYASPVALAPQGTSSMAYPIKNLRIAFKKALKSGKAPSSESLVGLPSYGFDYTTNQNTKVITQTLCTGIPEDFDEHNVTQVAEYKKTKIKVKISNDSREANIFCLKADVAESSGSHNTGFARLVDTVMKNSSDICEGKTIPFTDNQIGDANVKANLIPQQRYDSTIRTTIDGVPIYLFVKKQGESDENAQFQGKFNFNSEKSSEDVFGFKDVNDDYTALLAAEYEHIPQIFNSYITTTGNSVFTYEDIKNYAITHPDNNPTECWEFSTNDGEYGIGSFNSKLPNQQDPFRYMDNENKPFWLSTVWEYRFPDLEGEADVAYQSGTQPLLLKSLYKFIEKYNINRLTNQANAQVLMEGFATNLSKYFNLNYLLKYFVLTKLFGNVDQRVKNCMLSFYYDPLASDNTGDSTNGLCPMGHMRAFYIFYDNDTILGVNNDGNMRYNWDIDEESYQGYNAETQGHGLWANLEWCFNAYANKQIANQNNPVNILGELIQKAYNSIRGAVEDPLVYFNRDQVDKYPDAAFNVDAEIKYFYPKQYNNTNDYPDFEPYNLGQVQGNRKYHRIWWLNHRLNWLDARYSAKLSNENSIKFKVTSTNNTDTQGSIKLTSAVNKWKFRISNQDGNLDHDRTTIVNADVPQTLNIPTGVASVSVYTTIAGLWGASEIDLSNLQLRNGNSFSQISNTGVKPYLKKLIINSPESTYPKAFSSQAASSLISASSMPNLEELVACNTTGLDASLENFSNLTKIDYTGSNISSVTLPTSASLTSLKLGTVNSINITNKPNLNELEFTLSAGENNLTIGKNNSSLAYTKLLQIVNATNLKSLEMGTSDKPYYITDAQLTLLVNLVKTLSEEKKRLISGSIININASVEDLQVLDSCPNLTATASAGEELTLSADNTTIREGEEVIIRASRLLSSADEWRIGGSDYTNNNDLFELTERQKGTVKLVARNSINTVTTKRAVVYIQSNPEVNIEIEVQYIPITGIRLTSDNLVSSNNVIFKVKPIPETATKTLGSIEFTETTYDSISGQPITSTPFIITETTSTGTQYVYELKGQAGDNTVITATASGFTNSITFTKDGDIIRLKNGHIVDPNDDSVIDESKAWLESVLRKFKGSNTLDSISTVSIGTLNSINLGQDYITQITNDIIDTETVQDMEYLKYLSAPSLSTFQLPSSWKFTNLEFPNTQSSNISRVEWHYTNATHFVLGKIVFPKTMTSAILELSGNQKFDVVFDFSKTSITKIYNGGSNPTAGSVSLDLSYTGQASAISDPSQDDNPIFILPSTIKELGNYQSTHEGLDNYPSTMFNISGETTSTGIPSYALYRVPVVAAQALSVGAIFGYVVQPGSTAFDYTTDNIGWLKNTYYTFYKGSALPNATSDNPLSITNLESIGAYSFYQGACALNISSNNLTKIGQYAFYGYSGAISFTGNLSQLERIDAYAFAYITSNPGVITIQGNSNKNLIIGDHAFALQQLNTGYTVSIKGTYNTISIHSQAFIRETNGSGQITLRLDNATASKINNLDELRNYCTVVIDS